MTNRGNYITIEQAAETKTAPGQFWELHPDATVEADEYDDEGNIIRTWELTNHAAIMDLEAITDESYRLWGNQYGDAFKSVEANIDGDTLVRLIDALSTRIED